MTNRCRTAPSVALSLLACLAACGGGPEGPATPAPPPADFDLSCDPAGFAAGRGCATSTCRVSARNGFTGNVSLACAGAPAGLRCGFSPQPVAVSAERSGTAGFTVSADATVPALVHTFEVVAEGGGLRRTRTVQVQVGQVPAPSSPNAMTIVGCAGYLDAGAGLPRFQGVFVGAWAGDPRESFCDQVLAESDGSFVFELPRRCFREGDPVHLTAGGWDSCVAPSYAQGTVAHVTLLGRPGRCP